MMDEQMETEGVIELGEKLVHLDLKGAPPRISYYEKLFPLLHHWGATGVLIEYEDMFPYHGNLSALTSRNVYSVEDINKIQSIAQQNSLTVIPLVQTFGHLEFVLKHSQYSHLREVPNIPMSLCPLHKESLQLVTSMLDQVIELHPNIQSFHIGADEVFFIAECERCQLHLDQDGISQAQLFLSFVMKVILNLKAKHPKLRIIMWDDMFRDASSEIIKDSGIGELAEPMVWSYEKTLNLPEGIWDKYTENFDGFWLASAFKGATGPCMNVTDIDYHVGNHVSWLKVVREQLLHQKGLQGFCITGWQRYDHYAVLCELIPSSLPCLAVCLRTLVNGNFTADVHQQASEDLDFTGLIPLSPFRSIGLISECKFAGSTIYICIQQHLIIYERAKCFINNDSLCGWMSDYHVKRNFTNPAHLKNLLPQAHQLVQAFQCIQRDLYNPLCEVYYKDVFEEWVAVNITPMLQQLQTIIEKIDTQLALAEVPRDINLLQRQRSSYDNTENS